MRFRVHRIAIAGLAAAAVAVTPAAGARAAASGAPGLASVQTPAASQVLLITGTRLLVSPAPGGSATTEVLPGSPAGALLSLSQGGATEEIPAAALPYLGHGLAPSLFNLGDLERTESGGRIPVQVTFTGKIPNLPGVTITSSAGGTAAGYLTPSGAAAFGAALARQPSADLAGAGLFAGGTSIALAGVPAPAAPAARPGFVMHTLTVDGTNAAGKPDTGDSVTVFDGSDLAAFIDPNENQSSFYDGVAKFSVPAGDYWVIGTFTTAQGGSALDIAPEKAVQSNTTVHLAVSAASSDIAFTTPRPAVVQQEMLGVRLTDPHGTNVTIAESTPDAGASSAAAPAQIAVSPVTSKPLAGALHAYAFATLDAPAQANQVPYAYNLAYAETPDVIPVSQRFVATAASLAAVTENYYQDAASEGDAGFSGAFPGQFDGSGGGEQVALPGQQLQYFSTAPDLDWSSKYYSELATGSFGVESGGEFDYTNRVLSPGPQTVDWGQYPLHPQTNFSSGSSGDTGLLPSAARAGNALVMMLTPFSDNVPGHLSQGAVTGGSRSVTYQIEQNGKQIASGATAGDLIPPVTLSQSPSVVTATLDATISGALYKLSASTQTTWTWKSAPDPSATVPAPWGCITAAALTTSHCVVQPIITLDYQVKGLSLAGAAPAGAQRISLHLGHIQAGSQPAITAARAQVSCDGGTTWQQAAVTAAGGGNFTISYTESSGCLVTTRVTATDAAGGSVTETIDNAYQVG